MYRPASQCQTPPLLLHPHQSPSSLNFVYKYRSHNQARELASYSTRDLLPHQRPLTNQTKPNVNPNRAAELSNSDTSSIVSHRTTGTVRRGMGFPSLPNSAVRMKHAYILHSLCNLNETLLDPADICSERNAFSGMGYPPQNLTHAGERGMRGSSLI